MGTPNFKREYTMFMDWKMGNCQSVHPHHHHPQINLQGFKTQIKVPKVLVLEIVNIFLVIRLTPQKFILKL